MKDSLNLIINFKKTIVYLDKIVINFPNGEKILKDNIRKTMFDTLELLYKANEFKEKRKELQIDVIIKIKMLDFYLKIASDKKYISYKKYQKVGSHLLDLLKQIYGWMKYEKSEGAI